MKIKDFIKKFQELGYDDETELDIDVIDGESGESYSFEIDSIEDGEWVSNNNEIGIILKEADNYKKALTENAAYDITMDVQNTLNKYLQ